MSCVCVQCVSGHRAEEAVEMLKTFYKQENPNGDQKLSCSSFFSPFFLLHVLPFSSLLSPSLQHSLSFAAIRSLHFFVFFLHLRLFFFSLTELFTFRLFQLRNPKQGRTEHQLYITSLSCLYLPHCIFF